MPTITTEMHDKIGVIRLTNGVTNAITTEMVTALDAALAQIPGSASGLVIAGGEKFFSMGFDLPRLMQLDRPRMAAFLAAFNGMLFRLFTLPLPTACAIAGHAVAGGHVIALGADIRVAAPGAKLGLIEIKLGLPVPYLPDMILRLAVGDRVASEVLYKGEFIAASDAAPLGLVDALVSKELVEAEAMSRITALAANAGHAFATMKSARIETVCHRYERSGKAMTERLVESWFSEPAQTLLREAANKF